MGNSISNMDCMHLENVYNYFGMAATNDFVFSVAGNTMFFAFMDKTFNLLLTLNNKKLTHSEILDITGNLNSLLHSTSCVSMCFYSLFFSKFDDDYINGYNSVASSIFSTSIGYFIWDFLSILFSKKKDYIILIHHFLCIFVYITASFPFLQFHSIFGLLYEFSTPFLCIRNIMIQLKLNKTILFGYVEKMFAVSFFLSRIVMGLPVSAHGTVILINAYKNGKLPYLAHFIIIFCSNSVVNSLNIMWLKSIVKIANGRKIN